MSIQWTHFWFFFLNRSFLDVVENNQKPVLKKRKSLPFLYINLKWRAKFLIYRLHICNSDWLNFIHFSGYKYKIRLVSILRKREDQALISISTVLKFSAQILLSNFFETVIKKQNLHEFLLYQENPYDHFIHQTSTVL